MVDSITLKLLSGSMTVSQHDTQPMVFGMMGYWDSGVLS